MHIRTRYTYTSIRTDNIHAVESCLIVCIAPTLTLTLTGNLGVFAGAEPAMMASVLWHSNKRGEPLMGDQVSELEHFIISVEIR